MPFKTICHKRKCEYWNRNVECGKAEYEEPPDFCPFREEEASSDAE